MSNLLVTGVKPGDLFLYQTTSNNLVKVDDQYIESVPVVVVQDLLRTIRFSVAEYESLVYKDEEKFMDTIRSCSDVVFKCIDVHHWRKGFAFVFLQISWKDGGSARLTVFTTNTVHHSSDCFGTAPPNASDAKSVLVSHISDKRQVIQELEILKLYHATEVSANDLATKIQT